MQCFEKVILGKISYFKVPSNIDFDLFISLNTWFMTLGPFDPIWR